MVDYCLQHALKRRVQRLLPCRSPSTVSMTSLVIWKTSAGQFLLALENRPSSLLSNCSNAMVKPQFMSRWSIYHPNKALLSCELPPLLCCKMTVIRVQMMSTAVHWCMSRQQSLHLDCVIFTARCPFANGVRQASCRKGGGRGAAGSGSRADCPEETLGPTHALPGAHLALLAFMQSLPPTCVFCLIAQGRMLSPACSQCILVLLPALPQQHSVRAWEDFLGMLLTHRRTHLG